MGRRLDEHELRRRAIAGVRDEVEAFGSGAPDSALVRRDGLLAAVVPAAPQRSIFNSVFYDDPAALAAGIDSLRDAYEAHGVRAWTVWVPDSDRETARLLVQHGARVVIHGRSPTKVADVARELEAHAGRPMPAPVVGDLASLAAVRAMADELLARDEPLDVLLNNAGVMAIPRALTEDSFEMQLGVNHLAHFALTGLLLDVITATPKSRVHSTSSSAAFMGVINLDDLMGEKSYGRWTAYGQSKLASLPGDERDLVRFCAQVASGDPFTEETAQACGYGVTNLRKLRTLFINSRWAYWRNPEAPRQGIELTLSGKKIISDLANQLDVALSDTSLLSPDLDIS